MIIGINGNIQKENIGKVIKEIISALSENSLNYLLASDLKNVLDYDSNQSTEKFLSLKNLSERSDIIISVGGDGTILATAFEAQAFDKPVVGVNFGKLGFLAETDISQVKELIKDIKNKNYSIEERMLLKGICKEGSETIFAINDIVIDKGGWPKMIELKILVDDEYVTTFSADGVIVATPTGSTGYSLSCGGPIVSPKADVMTISPISPHSLSIRPLVLPNSAKISIKANSHHTKVQINCDGQRVYFFTPPIELTICKNDKPFKLIKTMNSSYFDILRNKLLWGLDVRNISKRN
ncbi:MAG: NAD(+) kinase [Chlorobiaceae bacterium]|nr:NAD(+) kinase [Chlorobiaceae bacterium]MBA4309132.1 NAD(+) kinase [Chlorobiaceae bacterium]